MLEMIVLDSISSLDECEGAAANTSVRFSGKMMKNELVLVVHIEMRCLWSSL